ncbi:MAG: hypothetical protein AAFZ04_03875 [Pseudomonadota bacterium]
MKQTVIYAGLALVIALALAVSLMDGDRTSQTRAQSLVSEFIILSAPPDPRGVDFLARARIQRDNRLTRLTHVQPEAITAYATALGLSEDALRLQIADPDQTGPFDHTGVVFDSPQTLLTGVAAPWGWALVTERAEFRASAGGELAACGSDTPCRAWILYWTAQDWYYAPVGAPVLMAALEEAAPGLAASLSAARGDY